VPLDDTAFYLPPEFLPLYGTAVWDAMTEEERYRYSRHECASLCSAGIWFENILMHLLIKHLYDLPADDGSHRYLLVETADECRHSAMFGEFIRQSDSPAYTVAKLLRFGGKYLKATTKGPEAYIAMLAAEELLDVSNRATMKDERVHATSRRIAKIHVMEEARHVSYARAYATEMWPTVSRFRRIVAMVRAPFVVSSIRDALVNAQVYKELGIADGAKIARHNPHHQARVIRDMERLTQYLEELGVINPVMRPVWVGLGLMAKKSSPAGATDESSDLDGLEESSKDIAAVPDVSHAGRVLVGAAAAALVATASAVWSRGRHVPGAGLS